MARKWLSAVLLAMACLASSSVAFLSDLGPEFQLGFKTLADLIPEVVGEPLEDEHHNPDNGDGLQQTTTGLMVWRKADNWTAFTDGWRTWVNGPFGLQERYNDERFDWETDAGCQSDTSLPDQPPDSTDCHPGQQPEPPTETPEEETPVWVIDPTTPQPEATSAAPSATAFEAATPETTPTASFVLTVHPTAEPTEGPTPASTMTPTIEPAATPTATTAASGLSTAMPTSAPEPSSTATPIPGGVLSETPAGDWVTSTSTSAKYYTTKEDPYWQSWAAGNRIWFASESALRAVYPTRDRRDWAPTTGPTATPTRLTQATATFAATPTSTSIPGGTISSGPAGDWVTSTSASAKYYTTKEDPYWQSWVPDNRIWFTTEAQLLAVYPGRVRYQQSVTTTPVPTATPTRLAQPTATSTPPQPTATRTPIPGGIISETPAGDWVTSTASNAIYYTSKDNEAYWKTWVATNRIWFATEGALLAAYPGRVKK